MSIDALRLACTTRRPRFFECHNIQAGRACQSQRDRFFCFQRDRPGTAPLHLVPQSQLTNVHRFGTLVTADGSAKINDDLKRKELRIEVRNAGSSHHMTLTHSHHTLTRPATVLAHPLRTFFAAIDPTICRSAAHFAANGGGVWSSIWKTR